MDINISVAGKIATVADSASIVCGNSDYRLVFTFDAEWESEIVKTCRFITAPGIYTDVVFEGTVCNIPVISSGEALVVGVFAGNLRTSTHAGIRLIDSITGEDGAPQPINPDAYYQAIVLVNQAVADAQLAVVEAEEAVSDADQALQAATILLESFNDDLGEGHQLQAALQESINSGSLILSGLQEKVPQAEAAHEALADPVTGSIAAAQAAHQALMDPATGSIKLAGDAEDALEALINTSKIAPLMPTKPIPIPTSFEWPEDYKLNVSELGDSYYIDKTPEDFYTLTPANIYYIDPIAGVDTNSGLTRALPVKTLNKAYALASTGDEIRFIANAVIPRGLIPSSSTKSLKIIADDGINLVLCNAENSTTLAWSADATYTDTFKATMTGPLEVYDFTNTDIWGRPQALSPAISAEACNTTINSYFITGTTVYVHTFDERTPDESIFVSKNETRCRFVGDVSVYLKNVKFYFGQAAHVTRSNTTTDKPIFLAENCEFLFAATSNNLSLMGTYFSYIKNCVANYAYNDGFNYHTYNSIVGVAVELNCSAVSNGRALSNINNGSTSHDGYRIVRISGEYYNNNGTNVAEANTGTMSLNIGCKAGKSNASDDHNADYAVSDGGTLIMYKCSASLSTNSVRATSAGVDYPQVYLHACNLPATPAYVEGTTVIEY